MKRKLFFVFMSLLMLAGFQVKAQPTLSALVMIETADSTVIAPEKGTGIPYTNVPAFLQNVIIPGSDNSFNMAGFKNEKSGYGSKLTNMHGKLVWDASLKAGAGDFRYVKGLPTIINGAKDRVLVTKTSSNLINFEFEGKKLTLTYDGEPYSNFVVYRSEGAVRPWQGNPHFEAKVPKYTETNSPPFTVLGVNYYPQYLNINVQDFNGGVFEGYLGYQATTSGNVDDQDFLIVVHNNQGVLSMMRYGDYVETLTSETNLRVKPDVEEVWPLYVKTQKIAGRWARPEDFRDHKFWEFTSDGFTDSKGEKLTVYNAEETFKNTRNEPYSIFQVKQVDFVMNGDRCDGENITNNIITHLGGAKFEGINRGNNDEPTGNYAYYGTAWNPAVKTVNNRVVGDSIIPLFVLSTPEDACKVLSVSRINRMPLQSQTNNMMFANRLEVREYGQYYRFDNDIANPVWADYKLTNTTPDFTSTVSHATDEKFDTYTSLQKFAIWIDIDGRFTLYPAATYSWQYGELSSKAIIDSKVRIVPNSVLIFNDINVYYDYLVDGVSQADKDQGVQIGWWFSNKPGGPVKDPAENGFRFTTVPNVIQSNPDYEATPNYLSYVGEQVDLKNRFYFMQVYPTYPSGASYTAAFGSSGYQWGNNVLSTAVWNTNWGIDKAQLKSKVLLSVPKERNMANAASIEYWRNNARDSVNMAAHWEAQAVNRSGGKWTSGIKYYIFINMLGDTLKFNGDPGTTGINSALWDRYLPENKLIPGTPNTAETGSRFFGRPGHSNVPGESHWFDLNPNRDTGFYIWRVFQLPRQKAGKGDFYMELVNDVVVDGFDQEITIDFEHGSWFKDTYDGFPVPYSSARETVSGTDYKYWQQRVVKYNDDIAKYHTFYHGPAKGTAFNTCPGMNISLEPIYYVPTKEVYIGEKFDKDNKVINTHDADFSYQDSLTAYTFLTGDFKIVEAKEVMNEMVLTYHTKPIGAAGTRTVHQARLFEDGGKTSFIPVDSPTGTKRTDLIKSRAKTNDELSWLWGETYKWYLVKHEDGKYLSFDTVNIDAPENRYKVGLVFTDSLENAIPIRLYQPLVGDKANDNFMIQFYIPKYKTYYNTNGTYNNRVATIFPEIDGAPGTLASSMYKDEVCFAYLGAGQSSYLYATRAYSGLENGTRFTFLWQQPYVCPCIGEFIKPDWMAQERLLNFPLNNEIWIRKGENINVADPPAWVAKGAAVTTLSLAGNTAVVTLGNIANEKTTTLKHTYVTSIYQRSGATTASVYIPLPANHGLSGANLTTAQSNATISGFATDVEVPLYYIQNEDGLYLTVSPTCDWDNLDTNDDVSGVKLQWLPLYTWTNAWYGSNGYDRRSLQLFAIKGCQTPQPDANQKYGTFTYLPLSSYLYSYKAGKFVTRVYGTNNAAYWVNYNLNLGTTVEDANGCIAVDITKCYRISQATMINLSVKDLVVFNSTGVDSSPNYPPVEVKWWKENYKNDLCDYFLVQSTNIYGKWGVWQGNKNGTKTDRFFYDAVYDTLRIIRDNMQTYALTAHWTFKEGADKEMINFLPELDELYGSAIGSARVPRYHLEGDYYLMKHTDKSVTGLVAGEYQAVDVSPYIDRVYDKTDLIWEYLPIVDTIKIKCTDHDLPYLDLEGIYDGVNFKFAGYNLDLDRLAVLEQTYLNRNLTFFTKKDLPANVGTEIYPLYKTGSTEIMGYRTMVWSEQDYKNLGVPHFLTIYRENRRDLAPGITTDEPNRHIIPYYSFSITKREKIAGEDIDVEYFLNVNPENLDSVTWTKLNLTEREILWDWEQYPEAFANFKFCLPFMVETYNNLPTGVLGAKIIKTYEDTKFPAVYLQSLDLDFEDYPYEIMIGASSRYITARPVHDPVNHVGNSVITQGLPGANSLKYNIYTIDYAEFDNFKITGWIFGGMIPGGNIWVPLMDLVHAGKVPNEGTGVLSMFDEINTSVGKQLLARSKETIDYGILTGPSDTKDLTVVFKGDTLIGNWSLRPIWYYNIKLDNKYFTDGIVKGTAADYNYTFGGKTYHYGYFDATKIADHPAYVSQGILADQNFNQTFGFRYVVDDQEKHQQFYVVSHANYTEPRREDKFRFLAQVNGRTVFIDRNSLFDAPDAALVFQWGQIKDGNYVNLEVVGQGGIYGVEGGIKMLNKPGKVDIYSIDGRLINSTVVTDAETIIPASRGIAIVKTGTSVVKVVVQ